MVKKHFYDQEKLVTPIEPLQLETSEEELNALFCKNTFKAVSYTHLDVYKRQVSLPSPDPDYELRYSHGSLRPDLNTRSFRL